MARLTEEMVIARSKQSDLSAIRKLNYWGAELGDLSLLRRMPNLEVLALSINKIRSLEQFASCERLRELYVRKNEIHDLRQLRHLRRLPLRALWLEENPCARLPQYRATVLRNLPHLEQLDNVPVTPEEVAEAMRVGHYILDSDEEEPPSPSPPSGGGGGRHSPSPSPERQPPPERRVGDVGYSHEGSGDRPEPGDRPELGDRPRTDPAHHQCPLSPTRSPPAPERLASPPAAPAAMSRSHYDVSERERPADCCALRHSVSALSVKEYAYCNGGGQHHEPYCERSHERADSYAAPREWERESARGDRERERDAREYSAVMAERRGFARRPVTRNSNLLSAVLCLLKELDYPSLEVAEMAVRCRMDELAESQ